MKPPEQRVTASLCTLHIIQGDPEVTEQGPASLWGLEDRLHALLTQCSGAGGAQGSPFCMQPLLHSSHLCVCPAHTGAQQPDSILPQHRLSCPPSPSPFLFPHCAPRTHPLSPPILHAPLCFTRISSRIPQLPTCSSTLSLQVLHPQRVGPYLPTRQRCLSSSWPASVGRVLCCLPTAPSPTSL